MRQVLKEQLEFKAQPEFKVQLVLRGQPDPKAPLEFKALLEQLDLLARQE